MEPNPMDDSVVPMTYTMDLTRPIEAHGEEVHRLTLRDPDSGALDGVFVTFGPGGMKIDVGAMVKLVAAAADIPPSSARKIPMRDLFTHFVGLLGFFGIDIQATGEP